MLKNKKAQIGESLQDIVGLILITLLLIIFFVFSKALWGFSDSDIREKVSEENLRNQEHYSLYALLQTPSNISYDGKEHTLSIAELIRLSAINQNYKAVLEQEINDSLASIYNYGFNDGFGSKFFIPSDRIINVSLEIKGVK